MALCTKCGKEVKREAKFCASCGTGAHDDKKARVLAGEQKSSKAAFVVAAVVVIVAAGWMAYSSTSRAKSMEGGMMRGQANREGNKHVAYAAVKAANGEVNVPIDGLAAGAANYYVFPANGKEIKFFVLKASDGTVRVALDACNACYHAKLGYRHDGETMVCNNCGMGFKSSDIGKVSGGCNPVPVQNVQDGKTLTVKASDLEAGAKYF